MKVYQVGGCVRDKILGLEPNDIDWVVTGSTPEEMLSLGYKQVGADFPVFLHPETGEEYALARKEISTGDGYHDFSVEFGPHVTIEEDLARRDFTINSIAYDIENDVYIDPIGGYRDLENHILRENDLYKTMKDDPVRQLRAARFLAKFPFLNDNIRSMEWAPSLVNVTPERVYLELEKALMTVKPSNFFRFLVKHNAGKTWFKEIFDMVDVPQTYKWHMEGDVFEHTMMVLDSAARANETLEIRFAALTHDFGKTTTPDDVLPSHSGHEMRGYYMLDEFFNRLKAPTHVRHSSKVTARYHTHIHNFDKLKPKTKVKMYMDMKNVQYAWEVVAWTAFHDNEGKLPYRPGYPNAQLFMASMRELAKWDKLTLHYTVEEVMAMKPERRSEALYRKLINVAKAL
jgi:tRNA nucleotidyltransferase (CCA-adding enzyme)